MIYILFTCFIAKNKNIFMQQEEKKNTLKNNKKLTKKFSRYIQNAIR